MVTRKSTCREEVEVKAKIYSTALCPFCERAKMLLNKRNITFEELRVDLDQSLLREMLKVTNGAKTVPQIFINDQYIGGFDDLSALQEQGKLDELLAIV